MSIDYDRLRELLEQWQHGDEVRDQLEAQWDMELAAPNMARELLRQATAGSFGGPFLEKHPTPWRFIRETDLDDPNSLPELLACGYHDARQCTQEARDVVEDANGNVVFASWGRDDTSSHIEGNVRSLVDFINTQFAN